MLTTVLGINNHKIVPALFAYLFYRIDQKTFLNLIVENGYVADKEAAYEIKEKARRSGYVLKNCKLYAWACWTARRLDRKMPSPESFGVEVEDAKILKRLNLQHLDKRCAIGHFPAYALRSFERLCETKLESPDLKNYIGKFVTKKMWFLMKSFGETRHDLESQLKEAAITSWYKQYPRFDSELHMVNVAKANIHNQGHTMITTLSNKSRQRLQQNADGSFDALHVEISTLADVAAPTQYGEALKDHLDCLNKVDHKLNDRARQFLLCMAGQHNTEFSLFIGMDNEDAATEWAYSKYSYQCRKFFEVSEEKMEKLFSAIRNFSYRTNVPVGNQSASVNP